MSLNNSKVHLIRKSLAILLLLLAICAFGGGFYGMTGAENIPTEWLRGSPFHDYVIPGFLLFVGVGGSALFASILFFKKHRRAREAALGCGIILFIWIVVQLAIIGYVSWLQPAIVVTAIIILLLNSKLHNYEP